MLSIIRDTREQNGWDFSMYDVNVIRETLTTADYALPFPLYDHIRVERKSSPGEIYLNLGATKNRKRFHRELERLRSFKYRWIVCEFPESYLHTFPENSGIPKKAWGNIRISAAFLRKLIYQTQEEFDIPWLFFNTRQEAEQWTYEKFAEIVHSV